METTLECYWNLSLGNRRPQFARLTLSSCFRWVWINIISPWPVYTPRWCITLVQPWHCPITDHCTVKQYNFSRCLLPAAPLQISPALISVSTPQLSYLRLNLTLLQHNSFWLFQMESGCFSVLVAGTVPALAASLAVVAVFQLAGALLACCLARYWSLQRIYPHHLIQDGCHREEGMVWA